MKYYQSIANFEFPAVNCIEKYGQFLFYQAFYAWLRYFLQDNLHILPQKNLTLQKKRRKPCWLKLKKTQLNTGWCYCGLYGRLIVNLHLYCSYIWRWNKKAHASGFPHGAFAQHTLWYINHNDIAVSFFKKIHAYCQK